MAAQRVGVDMDHILDAMATREGQARFLFNRQTGEVVLALPDGGDGDPAAVMGPAADGADLHEIPLWPRERELQVFQSFLAGLEDAEVVSWLRAAPEPEGVGHPEGARRLARALTARPELRLPWESELRKAMLADALLWCASLDIEPIYEVREVHLPGFEPSNLAPPEDEVGLIDILLLGRAPEVEDAEVGKGEGHGDCVERRLETGTSEAAGRLFKTIARQWCTFRGEDFRKRLVPNAQAFELGRLSVRVHDTSVVVRVTTSRRARSMARNSR